MAASPKRVTMAPPKLVVVGSCNIDLIAYMERCPATGETVMGTAFERGYGGKGANQCVVAAKLGGGGVHGAVAMVSALGDDGFGADTLAHFAQLGIGTELIATHAGVSSGVAPIWVDATGANRIVVVPGANALMTAAGVRAALAASGAAGADAVLCQLEVPLDATAAALACARARGAVTFLTPAPAPPAPLPRDVLASVSVLVPNEGEARALAAPAAAGARPPPLLKIARALLGDGCGAVVVTLGARGALVALPDGAGGVTGTHVPAATPPGPVVDTTGAGDAFTGALAYFYTLLLGGGGGGGGAVDGAALVEAARRASVVASDSVTKRGTQSSYATRADLPDALFAAARGAGGVGLLPVPTPWAGDAAVGEDGA